MSGSSSAAPESDLSAEEAAVLSRGGSSAAATPLSRPLFVSLSSSSSRPGRLHYTPSPCASPRRGTRKLFVNEARAGNDFFVNLAELRRSEALCDVELICAGSLSSGATDTPEDARTESDYETKMSIHAHRVVLAASSAYFRAMFTSSMRETLMRVIEMKDIDGPALAALIDYMYTGNLEMDEHNVQALLVTAGLLALGCARDACSRYLLEQLDTSNCLGISSFAQLHSCTQLAHSAKVFCQQHFRELVNCDELMQLDEASFITLISDDRLTTKGEQHVYEAVVNWVKHDPLVRKEALPRLLAEVRLPLLPDDYLLHTVSEEPLLMTDEKCKDLLLAAFKYEMKRRKGHLQSSSSATNAMGALAERLSSLGTVAQRWTKPRLPVPLSKLVMLIGGQAPKAVFNVETFDLDNQKWTQLAPLPQRRCRCGVASLGDLVYVVGGFNGSARVRTVDIYDAERDLWQAGVPMEQRRSTLGVAVLAERNLVMAVGGFDGSTGLSSAEQYDPRAGKWQAIPSMAVRRSSVAVAAVRDSVYAVGGYDGYSRQCLGTVEIFDARANRWRFGPCLRQVRSGAAITVVGDSGEALIAIGGHDGPVVRSSVEVLHLGHGSADTGEYGWERLPEMSSNRRNASVVALADTTVLALGGDDGQANLDSIETLITDSREPNWTELPVLMPQARSYCGVALLTKK